MSSKAPQSRPLFPADVVTWIAEAHKLDGDRTWRPGPSTDGQAAPVAVAQFKSLRVISRRFARAVCRETLPQMFARLAAGVPARSHRRHGRASLTRFQRRWSKTKLAAHPQTSARLLG